MKQILGVIHKMIHTYEIKNRDLILQDVFETILEHGTFKMIEELYEYLNLYGIKGNSKIDNIFFNAIRKHNEILELVNKKKQSSNVSEEVKLFNEIQKDSRISCTIPINITCDLEGKRI